jgi:hypothetical protein
MSMHPYICDVVYRCVVRVESTLRSQFHTGRDVPPSGGGANSPSRCATLWGGRVTCEAGVTRRLRTAPQRPRQCGGDAEIFRIFTTPRNTQILSLSDQTIRAVQTARSPRQEATAWPRHPPAAMLPVEVAHADRALRRPTLPVEPPVGVGARRLRASSSRSAWASARCFRASAPRRRRISRAPAPCG